MVEKTNLETKHRVALIGASGAIGREVVDCLMKDNRFEEIILVCRRTLPEWIQVNSLPKLTIVSIDDFDSLNLNKDKFIGVDAFLCCLGARTKVGEANFIKVDYTYPLEFAKMAAELQVKHYGLLSGGLASPNSPFLLFKTKGRVEAAITEVFQNGLTIYRPALLTNRRNDERFVEKMCSYIPFIPKIESRDMGAAMVERAVQQLKN